MPWWRNGRRTGLKILRLLQPYEFDSRSWHKIKYKGPIAQWLEQLTHNQLVVGSIPTGSTVNKNRSGGSVDRATAF